MRISDWSSDVCSSDLIGVRQLGHVQTALVNWTEFAQVRRELGAGFVRILGYFREDGIKRSEEHTSELQSLMRISYAVFCLKKKKTKKPIHKRLQKTQHNS